MVAPGWAKRVPLSASISPAAIFSKVDLPEPLRPTRHSRSPVPTLSSAPSSSFLPPKATVMSFRCRTGGIGPSLFGRSGSRRGSMCGTTRLGSSPKSPRLGGHHDPGARLHLDGGVGPVRQRLAIEIQGADIALDGTLHQQALAVVAPHHALAGMADLAVGDVGQFAAVPLEDDQLAKDAVIVGRIGHRGRAVAHHYRRIF